MLSVRLNKQVASTACCVAYKKKTSTTSGRNFDFRCNFEISSRDQVFYTRLSTVRVVSPRREILKTDRSTHAKMGAKNGESAHLTVG